MAQLRTISEQFLASPLDERLGGIEFDGTDFRILRGYRLYRVDTSFNILDSFLVGDWTAFPRGLTMADGFIWVVTDDYKATKYNLAGVQQDQITMPGYYGLCFDSTYLYTISYVPMRLSQVDFAGVEIGSRPWPVYSGPGIGLYYREPHFWFSGAFSPSYLNRLHYDDSDTYYVAQYYKETSRNCFGLVLVGNSIWATDWLHGAPRPLTEYEIYGNEVAMWVDSKQIPFAAATFDGALYIKRRSDSPATWNNAILIDNSSSAGYSNPGIVMTDDGRIIVTALDGDEATVDAAYVTFYSDDLGQTFVGPV